MRPIDADALMETFETRCVLAWVKNIVNNTPTIDAAPVVHGEWIVQTGSYDPREMWIKCSVCNYPTTKSWGETKYCPNCGAKMNGGANIG